MERSEVHHISDDSKYRVSYEQSATKGIIGFKVEAHGDDFEKVVSDANQLLIRAHSQASAYNETKDS